MLIQTVKHLAQPATISCGIVNRLIVQTCATWFILVDYFSTNYYNNVVKRMEEDCNCAE